jgi:hypothetical protein
MLFDPGHDHLLSGYFGLPRSGWLTEPSTYSPFRRAGSRMRQYRSMAGLGAMIVRVIQTLRSR